MNLLMLELKQKSSFNLTPQNKACPKSKQELLFKIKLKCIQLWVNGGMEKYPVVRQNDRISGQVPKSEYFDQDSKN